MVWIGFACVNSERDEARAYMDHLLDVHKVSERTYNNRLTFCRMLWKWMVEEDFATFNPFERIRVKDIDLDRRMIRMSGDYTKSGKARYPIIPDVFARYLETIPWSKFDPDHYLISETWVPGPHQLESRYISREWGIMCEKLSMPMKYQFYSLRDTGIGLMLEDGIKAHKAMTQSGHSDLSMMRHYTDFFTPEANEDINKLDGFK